MAIQPRGATRIRTDYWPKPIPTSTYDWSAVDDDIYDGAPDSHCPVGFGRTEDEAIADLIEQMEDA